MNLTTYDYDGGDNVVLSTYNHFNQGITKAIRSEQRYDHAGRVERNYFQVGSGYQPPDQRIRLQ